MRKQILVLFIILVAVIPIPAVYGEGKPNAEDIIFYLDAISTPEKITFELVLRNDSKIPVSFEFPSSQFYEILVINKQGQHVYKYSDGKAFAQGVKQITLQPGKETTWQESWLEHQLPKGEYKVSGELEVVKINNKTTEPLITLSTVNVPAKNPIFKQIKVSGENGIYQVKGLAKPENRIFYYTVEDGHHQQIEETKMELAGNQSDWKAFDLTIKIPQEKLPQNGTLILNLYERSGEEIINNYPIVLEKFY